MESTISDKAYASHHQNPTKKAENKMRVVVGEMGSIPEVPVDFMLQHIIPSSSNVDTKATMAKLKDAGVWSETSCWKALDKGNLNGPAKESASTGGADAWCPVGDVYGSIINSAQFLDGRNREPTLTFEQSATTTTVLDTAVQSRPDCFGSLTTKQNIHTKHLKKPPAHNKNPNSQTSTESLSDPLDLNWFDIACVAEFKVNNTTEDLNDNVLHMIWKLHRIMQVDHRRRFTFGITLENEDTRVWFACRQVVLVTRAFNCSTEASLLILFITSLAYATPTQLGYDPTINLKWRDNSFHYDIECTSKRRDGSSRPVLYRTQKVLSETAYRIQGRATRVYLATIVDQDDPSISGRHVVLKDSWIDAGHPKEGDTLLQLLEGASEEEKGRFLNILQHGVVQIDGRDDSTEDFILKGQKIRLPDTSRLSASELNIFARHQLAKLVEYPEPVDPTCEARIFRLFNPPTIKNSRSNTIDALNIPNRDALWNNPFPFLKKPILHPPKLHYRILFEDIGESLLHISHSGRITITILHQVMCDITKALEYMAKKGYVHRDVSPGNILWFGNHAKLSDLEYAKPYEPGTSTDTRPGTYRFMAGEVLAAKYSVAEYAKKNAKLPFIYNPVHDLESLWWVGVWCSMLHYPAPFEAITHSQQKGLENHISGPPSQIMCKYRNFNANERQHIDDVRVHGRQLFDDFSASLRIEEIHNTGKYISRSQRRYPVLFQALTFCLDRMRLCISWAYNDIQSGLPRPLASYFTDDLRIANPMTVIDDQIPEGDPLSVYERIVEALNMLDKLTDVKDAEILWPLDSIHRYKGWLETQRNGYFIPSNNHPETPR